MLAMKNRHPLVLALLACLSAAPACGSDDTLVTIGDREVSKQQFEAYLKFKRINASGKQLASTLDEYASRTALAAAVEREKSLDTQAIGVELEELKKEIVISRYFDKLLEERVGDDAVRNYYNSHEKDYEERKVHVAHILVRTTAQMDETARAAAMTRAQDAHSKLHAGADFAEVAKGYSEDRISAPRGGDLGWIKEGAIEPTFSKKAFEMKPGEISEPFTTQFGIHVLKVVEGPAIVKQPFEAVAGDIRFQLRQQVKDAEVKRLASSIAVQKNEKVLQKVATTAVSTTDKQARK
jgi:peptidyl-prolyl cis-trans isomerase C